MSLLGSQQFASLLEGIIVEMYGICEYIFSKRMERLGIKTDERQDINQDDLLPSVFPMLIKIQTNRNSIELQNHHTHLNDATTKYYNKEGSCDFSLLMDQCQQPSPSARRLIATYLKISTVHGPLLPDGKICQD